MNAVPSSPGLGDISRQGDGDNLPALAETARANFPAMYEAARRAVELCNSTDEVKGWADKHAALAAYARMRDDRDLHKLRAADPASGRSAGTANYTSSSSRTARKRTSFRIGRTISSRQEGDHLSANAAKNRGSYRQEGSRPSVTGTQAAARDGVTEHQLKTSLRIAAVPEEDFDRQVESPSPPTKTQLAEQGRMRRVPEPDPAAERFKALHAQRCTQFTTFCDTHDAIETAQTFGADDVEMALQVRVNARWMARSIRDRSLHQWMSVKVCWRCRSRAISLLSREGRLSGGKSVGCWSAILLRHPL